MKNTPKKYSFLASLIVIAGLFLGPVSGYGQTTVEFTTGGATTWTVPAGVSSVTVECWGAGGGGGGFTGNKNGSGGGGGGAYSSSIISVTPGLTYDLSVGTGGSGGVASAGTSGGDSWFIDAVTVMAKGGNGGSPATGVSGGAGGTGGLASAGFGTTKYSGGNGGNGLTDNAGVGGGGGSSAGTAADGTPGDPGTTSGPGAGGSAPTGGGDGGNGGDTGQNGSSGLTPGGAGGGSGEQANGGIGAAGKVAITYTAASCPESTDISPAGAQTKCIDDGGNELTAVITSTGGSGTPTLSYQWYYNLTDSNDPSTATTVGTNSSTYTPQTTVSEVGTRWYFCVGYASDNGCSQSGTDQTLASNTVQVTVGDVPATPGSISGTTSVPASTSGLTYSISTVPTATSYTWTVPSGWTINSGQGSESISVTSGVFGDDGDITVYASNVCGNSGTSTLAVSVQAPECPTSTSVAPSGSQIKCVGDGGELLTAIITTSGGSGSPTLSYQWYYNTSNSNDPVTATMVGTNSSTYTPLTTISEVGTRYYFCVGYATDNDCGQSSTDQSLASNTIEVTVSNVPDTPGIITGPATVPESTPGQVYSISAVSGATGYTWTVPSGWTIDSGDGTTSISVTSGTVGQDGDISVTADNDCGSSSAQTLAVTVLANDCPSSTSVTPSSVQTVCKDNPASQLTANVTTSGGSGTPTIQYQWYSNTSNSNTVSGATLIGGETSSTYTPPTAIAGSLWYFCVGYAADNGCGQTNADEALASNPVEVTVIETPATPGAITGPTPVPPSTSDLVYSVSSVPNATSYNWTVPFGWTINSGQGTSSISASSGTVGQDGDITVTATNTCGTSSASILAVSVSLTDCPVSTSIAPSAIQTVCTPDPANQLTATITTSGGSGSPALLYQWYYNISNSNTVAGATLIDGATNQNYTPLTGASEVGSRWYFCVGYATNNGCLQSDSDQTLASNAVEVTVNDVPATPGAITGSDNVTPSTSGLVYSISAVPTATSYTWAVPTGWSINSGQGSISISVTSGTEGQDGNISVVANNSCGASAPSTKAVTVTSGAFPPTITLGDNPTVCQGTTAADLPYTATTETPDQYSIDYFSASESQGFVDITNASLPLSPISLVVPGGAATGTYYGNLSVRNSTTGLSSGNYTISVTVITVPNTPGFIFGQTTVAENKTGLNYSIVAVPDATSYTWAVPVGWTITSGQGTTNIVVTSGADGQNGDITVYAENSCGSSPGSAVLAVVSMTPLDHQVYGCNACHITHNAPGGSLTSTLGNANLCISCHNTGGAAAASSFENADKAIPGTSGTSHSWDVPSVNATFETVLTTDPEMVLRVDAGNIVCSTCHDQHNSNLNSSYTRVSNAGDAMCKDCHLPRNVGRYADDISNTGSHPVGIVYSGTGDLEPAPTGSAIKIDGNVECSSCHMTHFATTSDGNLLRQTGDNTLCTSCHILGTHNGMNCLDCHQTHNTNKDNIYMIRNTITTPSSGDKTVVFTALTGTNSFADGDATYDGVCEVCHTTTSHYRNDGSAPDQDHSGTQGIQDGQDCTSCHFHSSNFSGGDCVSCHQTTYPTWNVSDAHVAHTTNYSYPCSTCHSGNNHNDGTVDVAFDPSGLATRNGLDSNTPVWASASKTCSNIYCHSDGRSAYRGTDGTSTWSSTIGSQPATYATIPAWDSGTPVSCGSSDVTDATRCHPGPDGVKALSGYLINDTDHAAMIDDNNYFPSTGSHAPNRGAHYSNSQNYSSTGTYATLWTQVQCFWCHTVEAGVSAHGPRLQGSYGSAYHVDGLTDFGPFWYSTGGTMSDGMNYSLDPDPPTENVQHCGSGKTCW